MATVHPFTEVQGLRLLYAASPALNALENSSWRLGIILDKVSVCREPDPNHLLVGACRGGGGLRFLSHYADHDLKRQHGGAGIEGVVTTRSLG